MVAGFDIFSLDAYKKPRLALVVTLCNVWVNKAPAWLTHLLSIMLGHYCTDPVQFQLVRIENKFIERVGKSWLVGKLLKINNIWISNFDAAA
jgi:hypothetical protein